MVTRGYNVISLDPAHDDDGSIIGEGLSGDIGIEGEIDLVGERFGFEGMVFETHFREAILAELLAGGAFGLGVAVGVDDKRVANLE